MPVRGGMVGSIARLKSAVKRGSGGWISNIPDGEMDVRFLTEPDQWYAYFEHFDDVRKYYPCDEQDCPGCREGNRSSQRWLAPALNMTDDKQQIIIKLPKSIIGLLAKYYEKFQTITDRDYTLQREGTSLDTTYTAIPVGAPYKINLRKYELPDLEAVLNQLLHPEEDEDDEDQDDNGRPLPPPARRRKATKVVRRRPDDDEDDEDDEDVAPRRMNGSARKSTLPTRSRTTPLPRPGQARKEFEQQTRRSRQPERTAKPLPRSRPVKRYDDDEPPF